MTLVDFRGMNGKRGIWGGDNIISGKIFECREWSRINE